MGCSPWGCYKSDTTERLHFHFSLSYGEGNGNPLQCSCLENPRDGRAWWAAVYGVAQSRTRLKRLSSSSSIEFPRFDSCVRKISWRRDKLFIPVFMRFPGGLDSKESACNVGDLGSVPRLGRSPGVRERLPTPVFWPGEFHGLYRLWVTKSQTRLSNFHFHFAVQGF